VTTNGKMLVSITYQDWNPDDHKCCYEKTTVNFWLLWCMMFGSLIIMLYKKNLVWQIRFCFVAFSG
jgi:hypothetical protein